MSTYARRNLKWNGWGAVGRGFDLHGKDELLYAFLADALSLPQLPHTPSARVEDLVLPPVRATDELLRELGDAIGSDAVTTDHYERAYHAVGRSYFDLLRLRSGRLDVAPDVVVYPGSAIDVAAVLRIAGVHRFAVIPFGGGSSVVGGVEASATGAHAGVISLDTTRLNRVLDVDPVSHTARIEAGIYGPDLENALQARGFTLGHYPQSFEYSTLGGWIAARGAGQQSNRYGGAEKFLVAANVVAPAGELRTALVPRSAAGPGLNHSIAGSEGTLGVIVDATVKLHTVPAARDYRGALFPSFEAGANAIRALLQREIPIATVRLSDVDETRFYSKFSSMGRDAGAVKKLVKGLLALRGLQQPCLLLTGLEGDSGPVRANRLRVERVILEHGGTPLGTAPGTNWYKGRFEMPFLRDQLMDRGVGVDTLETSAEWSRLPAVHTAVRNAIAAKLREQGVGGFVMAHVSHAYGDGASIYFTFVFARQLDREIEQWRELKAAASEAIVRERATISHHHGVGVDHLPWVGAELGELGTQVIRGMQRSVDPDGIMNPGKLVP